MQTKVKKRLSTHHCHQCFKTRVIYNSSFTHVELFDKKVKKTLCNLPLVKQKSYSDVVKNNLVEKTQYTHKDTVVYQSTRLCVKKLVKCVTPAKPSGKSKHCRKFPIGKCAKFGSFKLETSNRFHALQNYVENSVKGIRINGSCVNVGNGLQHNSKSKIGVGGQKNASKKSKMLKIAMITH